MGLFSNNYSSGKYNPVPSYDKDKSNESSTHTPSTASKTLRPGLSDVLLTLSTLIVLICTILNLSSSSTTSSIKTTWLTATKDLKRPSQFVGLNRLYDEPSSSGKSSFDDVRLTNFPTLLQQVDSGRQSFVYPDDPRLQYTRIGTISPEDRPFLVTDSVSTVAQFRTRDYRMESCKLRLDLPPENRHAPSFNATDRRRDWIINGSVNMVTVYKLNVDGWLDPSRLSFSTIRPRRGESVAWFDVRGEGGSFVSDSFRCEEGEILSFEIAGGNSECWVDVWQDRTQPAIGFTIEQESTL